MGEPTETAQKARSVANRNGAAHRRPRPTTAAHSQQPNHQTLYEKEIYCKTQYERADRDSSKSEICCKSQRAAARARQQPPTANNPTARTSTRRTPAAKHNVQRSAASMAHLILTSQRAAYVYDLLSMKFMMNILAPPLGKMAAGCFPHLFTSGRCCYSRRPKPFGL